MKRIQQFLQSPKGLVWYFEFIIVLIFITAGYRLLDVMDSPTGWNIVSLLVAVGVLILSWYMSAYWAEKPVREKSKKQG